MVPNAKCDGVGFGRLSRIVAIIAHLIVIGAAAGLFLFAHPVFDDYLRASAVRTGGVLGSIRDEYTTWAGRWLGTGLSYLVSSQVDLRHAYPILLATLTVLYWGGIYCLIRALWRQQLSKSLSALFATSLLTLYWATVPAPEETFYWFTGGLENHLSLAGQMYLFAWLLRTPSSEATGPRQWPRLAGLALLALILPGFHELYGAFLCGILFVGAAVMMYARSPAKREWIVTFIAAVIGMIIVIASPGNRNRMASAPMHYSAGQAMHYAFSLAIHLAATWPLHPVVLTSTLLLALHPRLRDRSFVPIRYARLPLKWIVPIVGFGLIGVGLLITTYALASSIPGRTLNALYMIFLLTWYLSAILWLERPETDAPPRPWVSSIGSATLCLFALSLLTTENTKAALKDLRHDAPAYDRAMRQRDQIIEAAIARGEKSVHIPALPAHPRLYFKVDVVNDPNDFKNFHVRTFYGLDKLTIGAQVPPKSEP